MRRAADVPGIEVMEARFFGDVFQPHRHDTYAIGLTLGGVQRFRYRGAERHSLPGQIIVLHPDEEHDGGAGTDAGLHYRMLYLEPSLLARSLRGRKASGTIPFVREPVLTDPALQRLLLAAGALDGDNGDLPIDDLITQVTEGLMRHAGETPAAATRLPARQLRQARDFLDAHADRNVRSQELETVTGTDRFVLARAFRAAYGTSPHRYLLMRRLRQARALIEGGIPLAEAAAMTGFADQSHFSRHFKKTYGMTPGRWSDLSSARERRI